MILLIKPNHSFYLLRMNYKKKLFFFITFLLLNHCSFDSKTGIWGDQKKEREKIAELERQQKEIIEIEQIYSSDALFQKEIQLSKKIVLSNPKKNSSWLTSSLNNQNFIGNIYLEGIDKTFIKKKVGKNKFKIHKSTSQILNYNNKLTFSDDKGTIFNLDENGKVQWKNNIYKKNFKKIYKNLVISIYQNRVYVADNIGLIYALNLSDGKLIWIKNYGISFRSNIKVFGDKIVLIDQDNKIVCFSSIDGSLNWDIHSIPSFIKSQNLLSIAVSNDGYIFAITSSADVYKIDSNNGNIIWSRNTAGSLYANATDFFKSSEIILSNNRIFFSSGNNSYMLNADTGSTIWKNDVSSSGTPIVDEENIFLVTENGYFIILNKNTGEIISSSNILNILKRKKQKTQISNFIMGSGKIYSVTLNGFLITSSAISGKTESYKKIKAMNPSGLIIVNNKLFILMDKSKILGLSKI